MVICMHYRPSLNQTMLIMATELAKRGTCAKRQVGCILTDYSGRILSGGYNGNLSGAPHCIDKLCPGALEAKGEKTSLYACEAVHAEQNALIYADAQKVHRCYVTCSPCIQCIKLLMTANCQVIVFSEKSSHHDEVYKYIKKNRPGLAPNWIYEPIKKFAITPEKISPVIIPIICNSCRSEDVRLSSAPSFTFAPGKRVLQVTCRQCMHVEMRLMPYAQ